MKLLYIWSNSAERSIIERIVAHERPSWQLTCVEFSKIGRMDQVLALLDDSHDAIMLHLSQPPCVALKLAECVHRNRLQTRIMLSSRTEADPEAIGQLFAAHVHPDDDLSRITSVLSAAMKRRVRFLTRAGLERAIVSIFNSDDVLPHQFRSRFGDLYRGAFTFDDYRRFSLECLGGVDPDAGREAVPNVFISHSSADQALAMELQDSLARKEVTSFVACRNIVGGNSWTSDIRDALLGCREILVLITPSSKGKPWVMIEAGAAWVLGKRLTPCIAYAEIDELPEPLSMAQALPFVTKKDRSRLVVEVSRRVGADHTKEPANKALRPTRSKSAQSRTSRSKRR